MIRTLDELTPEARAWAEAWLDRATAAAPPTLRADVRDDLIAHLCERLDAGAAVADVERVADAAGPIAGGPSTARRWLRQLLAGLGVHDVPGRIAATWWNPADERLLVPRAVGLGWDLNFGAVAVRLGVIEPDAETEPFASTPARAFATAAAVPAALAAAAVLHYAVRGRNLPDRLPAHWNAAGAPDRWTPKRRAAAVDVAGTVVPAAVAAWAARSGRPGSERAGLIAGATLFASISATTTVARSLGDGRRAWLGPAMAASGPLAVGAVLVWLARAGRAEEIRRDLEKVHD